MNLDELLVAFEGIPCYTKDNHKYISKDFRQFAEGTRRHEVMQWFADKYREELEGKGCVL